jgi:hypothetical protein
MCRMSGLGNRITVNVALSGTFVAFGLVPSIFRLLTCHQYTTAWASHRKPRFFTGSCVRFVASFPLIFSLEEAKEGLGARCAHAPACRGLNENDVLRISICCEKLIGCWHSCLKKMKNSPGF